MESRDIISKLEKSKLTGRGGAAFPTYLKWQMVKDASAVRKYVVANGSEGEPNVLKDAYILENHPAELINGINIALKYLGKASAFIFLRKDYYTKYKNRLEKIIGTAPIKIFREKGGYLSGEETVLCEEIEHKLPRPRIKPPYPGQAGIFGFPTLINNIETFYHVSQVAKGNYLHTKFYTISGDAKNPGVYELPDTLTIKEVLGQTGNLPAWDYFLQVGGGASGEIFLPTEINQPVGGSGAIVIFNRAKTDVFKLMKFWILFFMRENCDKCTPCREGTYRLEKMLEENKLDKKVFDDLFFVLENTSFCALGKSVVLPMRSLITKLKLIK